MSDLETLCTQLGIKIKTVGSVDPPDDWTPGTRGYKVRLSFQGRRLTQPFFMGPAHKSGPTAADVLSCLIGDTRAGEMTFEEFCGEFGGDTDSRKHERTWKACKAVAPKIRRFLGESFDAVERAEH